MIINYSHLSQARSYLMMTQKLYLSTVYQLLLYGWSRGHELHICCHCGQLAQKLRCSTSCDLRLSQPYLVVYCTQDS